MGYAFRVKNLAWRAVLGRRLVAQGDPARHAIAITFDDGPDPDHTLRLAELLESHGARGTFFLVADRIEARRAIVERLVAGGHEIGNHSLRHRAFASMPLGQQLAEIAEADRLLAAVDGRPWHWFRPPRGRLPPRLLLALGRRRHPVAMWSLDSLDYRGGGAGAILRRFDTRPARPGDIVLFHDDNEGTFEALGRLLPQWRGEGFAFPTVTAMGQLGPFVAP